VQERRGPPPPSAVVAILGALLAGRLALLVREGERIGAIPAVLVLMAAVLVSLVAAGLAIRAGPRPWRLVSFLASVAACLVAWWSAS
jgi:hypothetical protein